MNGITDYNSVFEGYENVLGVVGLKGAEVTAGGRESTVGLGAKGYCVGVKAFRSWSGLMD